MSDDPRYSLTIDAMVENNMTLQDVIKHLAADAEEMMGEAKRIARFAEGLREGTIDPTEAWLGTGPFYGPVEIECQSCDEARSHPTHPARTCPFHSDDRGDAEIGYRR